MEGDFFLLKNYEKYRCADMAIFRRKAGEIAKYCRSSVTFLMDVKSRLILLFRRNAALLDLDERG
jgi:hypothetical protein